MASPQAQREAAAALDQRRAPLTAVRTRGAAAAGSSTTVLDLRSRSSILFIFTACTQPRAELIVVLPHPGDSALIRLKK
ncbi:hypothetical protein EJB05_01460 [Eragrostis curvula]|uniref:Uncharacterized protein n=1 Tax=Eragrostis curvula TaxID=38414 RepID=A0A5J9WPM5_9POAL|nr:hypothetical protein EJB05_01460 [Eragrostis curvula]